MAHKILVVGDVNGNLNEVFEKVQKLQTKQNFTLAIVVGNLFANPKSATELQQVEVISLLEGKIEVPLPTYFALPSIPLPPAVVDKLHSGEGELCANLGVLGRRVLIKTSEGIKIAAVGGTFIPDADKSMDQYESTYTDRDVEALAKDPKDVDILITSDWPADLMAGARAPYTDERLPPRGTNCIATLCAALRPKYHFSTSNNFYERDPFMHPLREGEANPGVVSRFISLAPCRTIDKRKWMYAFKLELNEQGNSNLASVPQGTLASPFVLVQSKKRKLDEERTYYRRDNLNGHDQLQAPDRQRKRQKHKQPPPGPEQCFFCFSNEACETHMIGSIGDHSYVTTAKGPLTKSGAYPTLDSPGHLLLIPQDHTPTIAAISDEDARISTQDEMDRYRKALNLMVATKSKDDDGKSYLGTVSWLISRSSGVHLHWQFLVIPVDLITNNLVEAAFETEGQNLRYPKFAKIADDVTAAEKGDYFKVMIWSDCQQKEMVLPLDTSFRFDLQFGRRVMAKLMELDHRMDWRACVQSHEEEERDAEMFKNSFRWYDFTLPNEGDTV